MLKTRKGDKAMSEQIGFFKITPSKLSLYYVYGIFDDKEMVFCGYSRFVNVALFKEVIANKAFNPNKEYTVIIFEQCDGLIGARNSQAKYIKLYSPGKNPLMNLVQMRGKKKVKCIETGEVFESVNAVCTACGISTGVMYPHLRGLPGHRTVRGRTYVYMYDNDEKLPVKDEYTSFDFMYDQIIDFAKEDDLNRPCVIKVDGISYDKTFAQGIAQKVSTGQETSVIEKNIMRLLLTTREFDEITKKAMGL